MNQSIPKNKRQGKGGTPSLAAPSPRIILLLYSLLCLVLCSPRIETVPVVLGGGVVVDSAKVVDQDDYVILPEPEKVFKPVFRAVYFSFDSWVVDVWCIGLIDSVGAYLKDNEGEHVELSGYCDERGSDVYNDGLGMRRAEAVRSVLVGIGIGRDRIKVKSYGERDLVRVGCGEDDRCHGENRRVEIKIIEEIPGL